MGQQPVVLDRLHRQIHAVLGGIGPPDLDQSTDHRHHLLDVAGGVRDVVGAGDVDAVHRPEPDLFALLGDVLPRPVLALGPVDDLVVDVGDVRHQSHGEARTSADTGSGRRTRASPVRGRGAAARTRSGHTGRSTPSRARGWRAGGPPGWRCRTGAARPPGYEPLPSHPAALSIRMRSGTFGRRFRGSPGRGSGQDVSISTRRVTA